ncbi:MAG: hypothetical protein AMJ81_09435 [Phycisphaerae bacterium SM23_33]|nr:MAG: hypothetical protein AMJ81_09435 [Phycisphaerae bacterium SM23_33]
MNQPPQSVPAPRGDASDRERKDKWAGWSLGLGIASFIPLVGPPLGLVGLALGVLALAGRTRRRARAVAGVCLSTAGVWLYVFFGFIAPWFRLGPRMPQRAACAANLNSIGKGYHIYLADYDVPPPNVQALIAAGTSAQLFKCPMAKGNRPSDYFFLPASGPDAERTTIVACDFRGNHKDGRNILYHSGSVRWTDEETFQAELAQPHNAAFAAALKKAEGPPPKPRPLWPR